MFHKPLCFVLIAIFILLVTHTVAASACTSLVAFGDSITIGMKASAPELAWATLYATERRMALDNRAVSGSVVADQLSVIRAYDGPARTALWLVCANDLYYGTPPGEFGATVQAGVDRLRERGIAVLLNGNCLPYARRTETPEQVAAYDAALKAIKGAQLIDIKTAFARIWLPDGTHPNDAGHRAIANAYEGRWAINLPVVTSKRPCRAPDDPSGPFRVWRLIISP